MKKSKKNYVYVEQKYELCPSENHKNLQKLCWEKNPDMEPFKIKIPRAPCEDFFYFDFTGTFSYF